MSFALWQGAVKLYWYKWDEERLQTGPDTYGLLRADAYRTRPDELDPDLKSRSPLQIPIFDPDTTQPDGKGSFGFNAATEEYEDLIKAGVIRLRPRWSPVTATSRSTTPRTGSPGTSDAVWPSAPSPRCARSSTGGRPAIRPRARAYARDAASRSSSSTGMA